MGVRFDVPAPEKRFYKVLIMDANRVYKVRFGSDKELYRRTTMHYLTDAGRMVPCLHEQCKLCHLPPRTCLYVPAQVMNPDGRAWMPNILPVGPNWEDVLAEDVASRYFNLKRKAGKNSTILWSHGEKLPPEAGEWPGFEVEPSLYRAWGQHGLASS